MPGEGRIDQSFLGDVGELGGGVVFLGGVVGIGIGVCVDVQCRHLAVLLADGACHRHGHRAVAADRDGDSARGDDAIDRLLGPREGVFDLAGRQADVAAIDQAERGHRIEVGVDAEAAHQRRLLAHRIGPAARADAHVGAAVEGDAQDRGLVGRTRPAVGHAHECRRRGEELVVGKAIHPVPHAQVDFRN